MNFGRLSIATVLWIFCSVEICRVRCKPCTKQNVERCSRLIIDKDMQSGVVLSWKVDLIKQHCSEYKLFSDCMNSIRPYCSVEEQLIYKGYDDAFDFLCDQSLKEYETYQTCFENADLQSEALYCNESFTERLSNLNGKPANYRTARICQYADDYIDCLDNLVSGFCGTKAAGWIRTFESKFLTPLLSAANCPGWSKGGSSGKVWSFVIAIVICLVVALLIVGLVLCWSFSRVFFNKRRRPSSEMPPPYTTPVNVGDSHAVNFYGLSNAEFYPNVHITKPPEYAELYKETDGAQVHENRTDQSAIAPEETLSEQKSHVLTNETASSVDRTSSVFDVTSETNDTSQNNATPHSDDPQLDYFR